MHVTPEARTELHEMLMRAISQRPESDDGRALSFRLLPATGDGESPGLGLTLDAPTNRDEVVEHEARSVLVLDTSVSAMLDGLTLDVVDTPEGTRLGLLE
jgi:hypothetical protein